MSLIAAAPTALVLVDYQQRLLPAIDRAAEVLAQALLLADIARALGWPVIGTEQNPRGLGPNADAIRTRCDTTLAKMHFDACADGLVEAVQTQARAHWLGRPGSADRAPVREVVVAGCEAHVCLMQTTPRASRSGWSRRPAVRAAPPTTPWAWRACSRPAPPW
jgi:nicotinamidase-related amidase